MTSHINFPPCEVIALRHAFIKLLHKLEQAIFGHGMVKRGNCQHEGGLRMEIAKADASSGIFKKGDQEYYAARRNRLRASIRAKGLDALLVCLPANRFYLSGFELHDGQPGESSGMLLICADGDDWLATDSRYLLAAQKLWPNDRIFLYSANQAAGISRLLSQRANIAGIESAGISWAFLRKLRAALGRRVALLAVDGLVEKLRMIKDDAEIAALKSSFALNHKMFDWLGQKVESVALETISEMELAWEIEKLFRENGAQELAFATIVATGKKGAQPHAVPGGDLVSKNLPLLVDAGCRVRNYCSDQTRSFWHGPSPAEEFSRVLKLVREAQQAAIEIMKPGVACSLVYKTAREVFEKAGVASAFTHGLGHGVGLETHEAPSLSPHSDCLLSQGMAVTVEPGLYYPEWGGVRWEYTVLVEEEGVRIL